MLVLETVLRIRREHASGKAIKAIARDLHLSRKVVRKAIRAPEADMGYRREVQPLPKLGPFQSRLDALLGKRPVKASRQAGR
jgi:transposase